MGDSTMDDNDYEEHGHLEENLFEDEMFETPEESEIAQHEVTAIDLVSKETIFDRLRYHFISRLSKVVQDWMKAFDLRGLDYYHFLMLMLKFFVTRGTICPENKRKKKTDKLRKLFTDEPESTDSSSVKSEKAIEDVFREYLEELRKTHPQLIENIDRKEEDKQRRKLMYIQKTNIAVEAFMEAKHKCEAKQINTRMCFLERENAPPKECEEINLVHFLKEQGFPISPKSVPSEVFQRLGLDRNIFNRDFPVMDEDDLMKLYENIFNQEAEEEGIEDDYDDILRRRGRFPFISTWETGEEEGGDINLAKWEQLYWSRKEEMERKAQEKNDREMKLCKLMLVRSGTSWKQELGYFEGWRDTTELGIKGRRAMKKVALKIIKKGYKFDYVLTSTLCRSWMATDLMLVASGQEMMSRHVVRALNPRHQGQLVGETLLGSASNWGWLPQESVTFLAPPLARNRDKPSENVAMTDPDIPDILPRAENIFMVQERVESAWNLIEFLFKDKGKRTILACAHRDSIEALLFHFYGISSIDFTVCHPSYTTPIILNFFKCGKKLFPAFIDFLCFSDEANKHSENPTISWFEKFLDQGLLDIKLLMEIINKLEPPDLEELCNQSFTGILKDFESDVDLINPKLRRMDCYLEQGCGVTSDKTVGAGKKPLSDNYTLEEQMLWIVERNIMPLKLKLQNLKYLYETMPDDTNPETVQLLKKIIADYEMILEQENLKMSIEDYPAVLEDIMEEHTDEAKLEEQNKVEEAEKESIQS